MDARRYFFNVEREREREGSCCDRGSLAGVSRFVLANFKRFNCKVIRLVCALAGKEESLPRAGRARAHAVLQQRCARISLCFSTRNCLTVIRRVLYC